MDSQKEKKEKYLVMPDSFKGTMDAITVCSIMHDAIAEKRQGAEVLNIPIADGGEGTVDCFLQSLGGEKISMSVSGPFGNKIQSFYGKSGDMGIIEMAAAAGFGPADGKKDPGIATTFGVGELVMDAVAKGCRKIVIGLGGSCTNDGGAGMAAALGAAFYDEGGKLFVPSGTTLSRIKDIDVTMLRENVKGVSFEIMCDIDNPLFGPSGAAFMFSEQKGADSRMVKMLDDNLRSYAGMIKEKLDKDVFELPGGGAAGGMGAGAYAFLDAEMKRGIDVVLDMAEFEKIAADCDAIFTGEGKLDRQSLGGKAVVGIARRAKKIGIPVIAVVGIAEGDLEAVREQGITEIYQTASSGRTYERKEDYMDALRETMYKILG
mgnify:CR=1 FL=1